MLFLTKCFHIYESIKEILNRKTQSQPQSRGLKLGNNQRSNHFSLSFLPTLWWRILAKFQWILHPKHFSPSHVLLTHLDNTPFEASNYTSSPTARPVWSNNDHPKRQRGSPSISEDERSDCSKLASYDNEVGHNVTNNINIKIYILKMAIADYRVETIHIA